MEHSTKKFLITVSELNMPIRNHLTPNLNRVYKDYIIDYNLNANDNYYQ